MNKIYCIVTVCFLSYPLGTQAQGWQWGTGVSGTDGVTDGGSECWIVKADHTGNVYTAGTFGDSLYLGSSAFYDTGEKEIFITKHDAEGNLLWVEIVNGPSNPYGLTIGPDNSVYLLGCYFSDSVRVGKIVLKKNDAYTNHLFIVKCDTAGNVIWAKTLAGDITAFAGPITAGGIDCDQWGNLYITGCFYSASFRIGSFVLHNKGANSDIFVARLDTSGIMEWAESFDGNGTDIPKAIAVSPENDIYITGMYESTVLRFTPAISVTHTSADGFTDNTFLVKIDTGGHVLWATGPVNAAEAFCIATDRSGNVLIGGYLWDGDVSFGNIKLHNQYHSLSTHASFLAKYDPSGNPLWVKSFYSLTGATTIFSIITDTCNHIFVSGNWGLYPILNPFVLDSVTSVPPPENSFDPMFFAELDSYGNVLYHKEFLSGGDDNTGLAADKRGNIYLTGDYEAPHFSITGDTLEYKQGELFFLAKYRPVDACH